MAEIIIARCGVYQILCRSTGRVYVGSSTHLQKRLSRHKWLLRNGRHDSPRLQNAWNKHGEENFEFSVLEVVENVDDRFTREQHWIDTLLAASKNYGLNMSEKAITIRPGRQPAHVAALSSAFHLGKPKSPEHRARISAAKLGTHKSAEEIERRSAKRRGRTASEATKALMHANRSGKPQPSKRALTFEIAEEIRQLRRDDDLSQDKIAAQFGCSRKSVREILAGNTYTIP